MLVVCNGAVKSGSTWMYNIVQNLGEFSWPEERFISRSNTKHPTIKEACLAEFLREVDLEREEIISKNHYAKLSHRELLLACPNTRILNMSRDARDVIVSSYYDSRRRNGFQGSFSDYYWNSGRFLVERLKQYHDVWATPHPQVMATSYEALKSDFEGEVAKIASFLDVELEQEEMARINKETSIESLRSKYKDAPQYNTRENAFFRKGEIGDWKNHFDKKMTIDYENISENGIGKLDFFAIRNRVKENFRSVYTRFQR